MAISYNGLWKILIDRGIGKVELAQQTQIGTATLAKMSKGEPVSLSTLERICKTLGGGVTFGDLVQYIPDTDESVSNTRAAKNRRP